MCGHSLSVWKPPCIFKWSDFTVNPLTLFRTVHIGLFTFDIEMLHRPPKPDLAFAVSTRCSFEVLGKLRSAIEAFLAQPWDLHCVDLHWIRQKKQVVEDFVLLSFLRMSQYWLETIHDVTTYFAYHIRTVAKVFKEFRSLGFLQTTLADL